jgi:pilus assembly protein TadC
MVNFRKTNKFDLGKSLIPEKIYVLKYKEELESVYQKLYYNNVNYIVITNIFFLSSILALVLYLLSYNFIYTIFSGYIVKNFIFKFLILFFTYFVFYLGTYYTLLIAYFLYNDSKFKKIEEDIEEQIPEFIDNLVSNLKGGISLEKALMKSVRKDQKSLLKEVTLINEKVLMGKDINTALKEFRDRFESPVINRTFFLVEEGLKGGGNLAAPLERISINLKKIYQLNNEIINSENNL